MVLSFVDVHAEVTGFDVGTSLNQSTVYWLSDDPGQGNKTNGTPRMLVVDAQVR